MAERKKGEMDGEQHSLSLANSSREISQRQHFPSWAPRTSTQHQQDTISSQVKCLSGKG